MTSFTKSALLLTLLFVIASISSKLNLKNKIKQDYQSYIDKNLLNYYDAASKKTVTGVLAKAAIVSNVDGTVRAISPKFELSKYKTQIAENNAIVDIDMDEFANIVDAFKNSGKPTLKGGITLNKLPYYFRSFDAQNQVLYLKKVDGGATIAKTNQSFIIGVFSKEKTVKLPNGQEVPQDDKMTDANIERFQKLLLDLKL